MIAQSNDKQEKSNDIQNDNQEEDYVELNKKIPKTIREYMNKNKLADRKLFSFSKQGQFKPYSTNCGAVDSRQPIIVTNLDIENMKTHKNFTKEAIESIEKDILEWGSSSTNLNKFICTRIWR